MLTFDTPVLFLVFNRPEHTSKVFARIREAKPKYLFIAADGPRSAHPKDGEKCAEVRELVTKGVDWECDIKTLFRAENLGCGHAPAAAISWFFENVDEGIILEDDCLPTRSFFWFCEAMLKKFKMDEEVVAVSGYNFFGEWNSNQYDYFFSDGGNWGWASWRRAWKLFDYTMSSWSNLDEGKRSRVLAFYPDFQNIFEKINISGYDAWDIQWHFARLVTNGLTVTPSKNLVSNIGFDAYATHTFDRGSALAQVPAFEIPQNEKFIGPNEKKIDLHYRSKILGLSAGKSKTNFKNLGSKVKAYVKRIIR